jgi:hypothetical protein
MDQARWPQQRNTCKETQRKSSALAKGKKQEDDKSRDFIGMDNVHSGQAFSCFSFSKICDVG